MADEANLRYSSDHMWGAEREDCILVGVTPYLVARVNGELRCHLPSVGERVAIAAPFGALEATKVTMDLFSPCEGTVTRVNEVLLHDASVLRREPWEAWLIAVHGRLPPLLSAAEYRARFEGASTRGAS